MTRHPHIALSPPSAEIALALSRLGTKLCGPEDERIAAAWVEQCRARLKKLRPQSERTGGERMVDRTVSIGSLDGQAQHKETP